MKHRHYQESIWKHSCKRMTKAGYTDRVVLEYFRSLKRIEYITPRQFRTIVKMMQKFQKLFECAYDIHALLGPILRLYYDLTRYELSDDEKSPSEKTFIKICRLYGTEID